MATPAPAVVPLERTLVVGASLGFVAGFVDTVGFIALFGLFTSHVTGNFVLIGSEVAHATGGVLGKLLALPAFVLAVALTRLAIAAGGPDGRGTLRQLLLAQAILLAAFMIAGLLIAPPRHPDGWAEILTGLIGVAAMGVQNAKSRLLLSTITPTTVMTGNVTQVVIDAVDLMRQIDAESREAAKSRLSKMLPPVGTFALGAVTAGLTYMSLSFWCLLAPIVVLCCLAISLPRRS